MTGTSKSACMQTSDSKAILVKDIHKSYEKGSIIALDNVSLEVRKGELFGLIGPDGAGKTTLLRIIATLLQPDSGSAMLDGFDCISEYKAIRKRIGYMPGRFSLYQDLTVAENLTFFATIFNTSIVENYDLIKDIYIQIEPFKDRRAGKLSGGMKQKLALCCALIHKPSVLILDEPTTGVDPVSRKEFWEMLARLQQEGITIIVSTPYMDEAIRCDRIAFINHGKLLTIETPQQIISNFEDELWSIQGNNLFDLMQTLRGWEQTKSCFSFGDCLHFIAKSKGTRAKEIAAFLEHKADEIHQISPTIEDCFMAYLQN